MPRHLPFIFVETNFLYELLRPEYAASKDVKFLYDNFQKKRIQIQIPNLCFKEAIRALREDFKDRLPVSVTEFHRHFASLKKKKWDADQVAEFLKHNRDYHAQSCTIPKEVGYGSRDIEETSKRQRHLP